jgi:FkbM family methyltransferase
MVLFDVGANVGEWSRAALEAIPDTHVHAFEIAPATAKTLAQSMARFGDRITINTCGLGAREGEIKLYFSPESSTAASTVPGVVELSARDHGISRIEEVMTRITTGDRYLHDKGIAQIDLLKIDVEGAEWDVLEGFSGSFADGKIQMVQFEYGPLNLRTRKLLGDYWQFFRDRGFTIGKLYPEGVAFKTFDVRDEDFVGPNFIACLESRRELVQSLQCEIL